MTVYQMTMDLYLHGQDDPIHIEDASHDGAATAVFESLVKKQAIHAKLPINPNDPTMLVEVIIPYHAVMFADYTREAATVEDPEDAFCAEGGA